MRPFLVILLLSVCLSSKAQSSLEEVMPMKNGRVVYDGVVEVSGVSKDELFSRAKRWLALTYTSANDLIQLSDQDAGSIVVKGGIATPWTFNGIAKWDGRLLHNMTIDVKDGKCRYELNEFFVRAFQPSYYRGPEKDYWAIEDFVKRAMMKKSSIRYCIDANEKIKTMLIDLQAAMKKGKADF